MCYLVLQVYSLNTSGVITFLILILSLKFIYVCQIQTRTGMTASGSYHIPTERTRHVQVKQQHTVVFPWRLREVLH